MTPLPEIPLSSARAGVNSCGVLSYDEDEITFSVLWFFTCLQGIIIQGSRRHCLLRFFSRSSCYPCYPLTYIVARLEGMMISQVDTSGIRSRRPRGERDVRPSSRQTSFSTAPTFWGQTYLEIVSDPFLSRYTYSVRGSLSTIEYIYDILSISYVAGTWYHKSFHLLSSGIFS